MGNMKLIICFLLSAMISLQTSAAKEVPQNLLHSRLVSFLMKQHKDSAAVRLNTPGMDMSKYVFFFLYTRKNLNKWQELWIGGNQSLAKSYFDPSKETFIVIHGYINNINSDAIQLPKKNLLATYDCNVLGVDWSRIAVTLDYDIAAAETAHVGHYLSKMIRFLVSEVKLDLNRTHLIGHSLGAHVAGFAGKDLAPLHLARITGLDPAKPYFNDVDPSQRLNATDALFVDCIHTCSADLGLEQPICQANFYPNGGTNPQPGCPAIDFIGVCSHERSVYLFAESVLPKHKFRAAVCSAIPDKSGDNCVNYDDLMGQPASNRLSGIYYVKTRSKYPFAMIVEP